MMHKVLFYAVCGLFVNNVYGEATHWDYDDNGQHGPSKWYSLHNSYTECSGLSQSPINIPESSCQTGSSPVLSTTTLTSSTYTVSNTGHSLKATPDTVPMSFQNPLYDTYKSAINKEYCFSQLHFHWSPNAQVGGSEHTINGQRFPLEIHLVHYSCQYGTFTNAINAYNTIRGDDKHVLAVISVLFEIGTVSTNGAIDRLLEDYENIKAPGKTSTVKPTLNLNDFLPPSNERQYISYMGSLTTPTCQQSVRWFIMNKRMTVTQAILDKLRELEFESTQTPKINNRPIQNRNGRKIYYCQSDIDGAKVDKDNDGRRRLLQRLQQ